MLIIMLWRSNKYILKSCSKYRPDTLLSGIKGNENIIRHHKLIDVTKVCVDFNSPVVSNSKLKVW